MKNSAFLLLALLCLNSCDILNKDEDAVAFIRVNEFPLTTEEGEGSASENIKDVWLSVNGELIGGFEFPVDIPVLSEGPANIKAFAGILDNGVSTIRERYPFYEIYDVNVDLIDEQVTEIFPVTTYIQNALQFTIEDFEEPGIQMIRSLTSDTTINPVANPDINDLLRGENVGQINLEGEKDHFKVESTFELDLAFLSIVYMELDYRCETPFVVGLKRSEPSAAYISVAGFNPVFDINGDPAWNKVYINLADAIDDLQNGDEYEIFLEGNVPTGTEATFLFDNIKVIHTN
jgi:hypothetical protein